MAVGWRLDGGWMAATAPSTTLGVVCRVVCRDVLQRACGGGGGLRITAGFEQLHERVDAASVSNSHLILGAQRGVTAWYRGRNYLMIQAS